MYTTAAGLVLHNVPDKQLSTVFQQNGLLIANGDGRFCYHEPTLTPGPSSPQSASRMLIRRKYVTENSTCVLQYVFFSSVLALTRGRPVAHGRAQEHTGCLVCVLGTRSILELTKIVSECRVDVLAKALTCVVCPSLSCYCPPVRAILAELPRRQRRHPGLGHVR